MFREPLITKLWMTVAACAVLTTSCVLDTPLDAGSLDTVYANPAEQVELLSLGQDQTLGLPSENTRVREECRLVQNWFSIISEMISG